MAGGETQRSTTSATGTRPRIEDVLATDEAQRLLEAGQQTGRLDADEVALALDELELEPSQLDEFYAALDEAQIAVVAAGGNEPELEAPAEVEAEITTDSLQLFLKDIGKVPLLTASVRPVPIAIAPVLVKLGVVPDWLTVRFPPINSMVPLFRCPAEALAMVRGCWIVSVP